MKPIAQILVLDGPTHYGVPLPVRGPTDFTPRTTVKVYDEADLKAIQARIPATQIRVRVFPRIIEETIPASAPTSAPAETETSAAKGKKGR